MSDIKLVALIKTFSGDDWVIPCVKSIYKHVEKIVFVHSCVSWTGKKGNSIWPVVERDIMPLDYKNKIHNLVYEGQNQSRQCDYGMRYIKKYFPWATRVMMVDTDEMWDEEDLVRAKGWIERMPKFIAGFASCMQSYIKSPFYRINHLDPLKPMIFVPNNGKLLGDRGMLTEPLCLMKDVKFHHMCFVRSRFEQVLEKLINSHTVEGQKHVPLDYWIGRVWNRLPDDVSEKEGLHPACGYQNNWKGVDVISRDELPEVLRDMDLPILKLWEHTAKQET